MNLDPKAEAYYPVTPYQYVLNNPVVHVDHNGQWTVTRHYNMTYQYLAAAGIGKKQADMIAHYSAVYADNPGALNITMNNTIYQLNQMYYKHGVDYSGTKNSQVLEYNGTGTNYNIWHTMRSPWEKETNAISEEKAMDRGLKFGWGKIFESAESGDNLNNLKKNTVGMQALGQGLHALQDAYAHRGNGDAVGLKHVKNDIIGSLKEAKTITQTAITVHNLLTENWEALDKTGVKITNTEGMTAKQFSTVMSQALKYLKQKKDNEDE